MANDVPIAPEASASVESPGTDTVVPSRRRLLYALPVVGVAGLLGVIGSQLGRDPSLVSSPLIGKQVPQFDLPPVQGRVLGLSTQDLYGQVSLVNVFASWCVPCREEHPFLMALAREKTLPVYGINYKDAPADAATWLDANGDPYARTGADISGRVSIDWGVYGVPETYVVGGDGRIAHKTIGPLTLSVLDQTIRPIIEQLRRGTSKP